MDPSILQVVWFLLVGVLIAGYAILDGYDLGAGALSLFTRDRRRKRRAMDAIAPVWDGNEVWLVTGGGALFAAFPIVYATVFSGFYLALMLLLVALIFRAVSLEFHNKVEDPRWQVFWEWSFGLGSLLAAVLFGVAVGNILRGVPINAAGEYTGTFLGLLHPYPVSVGLLALAMFLCHGALYVATKSAGEEQTWLMGWAGRLWVAWVVLYALVTLFSAVVSPWLFSGLGAGVRPLLLIVLALLAGGATVAAFVGIRRRRPGVAFFASSVAIVGQIGLAALSLFPKLVPSRTDLAFSLTIANASSSERTLTAMLIITLIGMPIVLAYTVYIHRLFRGKVEEGY